MIRTVTAVAALCALSSLAEARVRAPAVSPECNVTMPCIGVENPIHAQRSRRGNLASAPTITTPAVESSAPVGVFTGGLVAPLQAKLASIQAACPGTHAISGIRHTRIRGTRTMSLHAQGKAVDVRGPYACIYAQLADWKGGYSTDSGRVQHIHISYDEAGGREMGLRFAHGGGRRAWRNAYARMR